MGKFFKQDAPRNNHGCISMEKIDKPLTRDELISMQVIDSKGRSVGKVKDVVIEVGKSTISLSVEKEDGEIQVMDWNAVQAASDFIILKPQSQKITQEPAQQKSSNKKDTPICPTCGKPLKWIPKYKRWYCYNDKKYV